MKRSVEDASFTIDDLRRRVLTRSVERMSHDPQKEIGTNGNREINREFKQYILAGVSGLIIALLIIKVLS